MSDKKNLGKKGEDLAVEYLSRKQYHVLYRNWKFGRKEVDIIAVKTNGIKINQGRHNEILHFIEVKTRKNNRNGFPEENVNQAKIKSMLAVAEQFIQFYPSWNRVQFDVLAITLEPKINYFFIEDIYL